MPSDATRGAAGGGDLPPVDTALAELGRRHARALAWLGVRIVIVGFLVAVLTVQIPSLGRYRFAADASAGVLALAPYFTGVGRLYAWRIALGRAYVNAGRSEDAVRTLAPLGGLRARVFDAAGEGRYLLGAALRGAGRGDEAARVFADLGRSAAGEWGARAKGEGAAAGEGRPGDLS